MSENCIFCKIINGKIKSKIIYENETVLAFEDIEPKAPLHVLIIPKTHIEKISDLDNHNKAVISEMTMAANEIADRFKITSCGYRLVLNCGPDAGQAVSHIHMHLLGGRKMNWPPG